MRLIQVGLGGFGRSWATLARDAEGVELVGVADTDPGARRWAESELGPPVFTSLDDALAEGGADAVLVVSPPETHHALVTSALEAGKHVLVEKPLATTLADARALVETAERVGRILMVSQNYRFRGPARAAQRVIREGQLGELLAVTIRFRRDTRALFPPGNFRYRMRHPVVLDMSIHHVDLLRALTGQEVSQIYARSWRVPDSPYEHDPAVIAVMTLDNGATVTYEGNWAPSGVDTSWNGDWEVIGEQGRLRWSGGELDAQTGEVTLEMWGEAPRPVEQPALAHVDRAGALDAFRAALERGAEPETSGRDNLHSLAIVLGCVASLERGEVVELADALT